VHPTRVAVAVAASVAVDLVYGFAVYGTILAPEIARYGGIFRNVREVNANLPWAIAGMTIAMTGACVLFAMLRRPGGVLRSGLVFGVVMGALNVGHVAIANYAVMKFARRFAAYMAVATFVEWIVIGFVIGLTFALTDPRRLPQQSAPRSPSA